MRHILVEGIVWGFLHAHAAGNLIFFAANRGWSSSFVSPTCALSTRHHHVHCICDYFNECFAVARLADAWPAHATPTPMDALPLWLLLVGRPRRMLCRRAAILVDAWPPSCCYRVLVSDLVLVQFV